MLLLVAPLVWVLQRRNARLEDHVAALRAQVAEGAAAEARARSEAKAQADRIEGLRKAQDELLRLRAEVARLRSIAPASVMTPPNAGSTAGDSASTVVTVPREPLPAILSTAFTPSSAWADVGQATPEAALQTLLWAGRAHRSDRLQQLLTAPPGEATPSGATLIQFEDPAATATASRIVERREPAPDEVEFVVEHAIEGGDFMRLPMRFRKVGEEWRLGPTQIDLPAESSVELAPDGSTPGVDPSRENP